MNNLFCKTGLQKTVNDKKIAVAIFIYTTLLLSYWSYLSPLYHSNGWTDPNIYFTIGKSIFKGKVLYADLFDLKGPVIFFIYGLGSLISDHSFWGVFLLEILVWFLMIFAIYRTAKFYLNNGFAYLVALLFPFCIVTFMKTGGSPDEFILAFECISLYFFVSYFKEKEATLHKPYAMLIHGILFALTFFCKFNLSLFWFFPVSAIFLNLLLKKAFRNFARNLLAFLSGFLLIAAPICIYLFVNHAFDDFYNSCFELTRKYSGVQSQGLSLRLLLSRLIFVYGVRPVELFILPLLGIFYFSFRYIGHTLGKGAILLAGISVYVAIFMSPVYMSYYPIPFLAFSALGIVCVFAFFNPYINRVKAFKVNYLIIMFIVFFHTANELKDLSDMKLIDSLKAKPGLPLESIRKEILKEKNPSLMTPCFGLGLNLFTTCRIVPNIRFFTFPYTPYESYPVMRDEQTNYIENKEVQFIVLLVPDTDIRYTKWNMNKLGKKSDTNSTPLFQYNNIREGNYNYFATLPALKENYELCLRDTIINTIEENAVEIYELYKRKE
jgi:hypothetical protein